MSLLRVLHVARNFPSPALPRLGLWTERLVRSCRGAIEPEVITPVPYWPPIPGPSDYTRFRALPKQTTRDGVVVHYPGFIAGPGNLFARFEGETFSLAVERVALRVHRERPVDVVHAHFVYPEGWTARRIAARLRVPYVITEQSSWQPWLDHSAFARARAVEAATGSRFTIAVSHALADSIRRFVDIGDRLRVIPNIVEEDVFTCDPTVAPVPGRLIFVGLIRAVKGLDVLIDAIKALVDRKVAVQLVVVGESVYGSHRATLDATKRQVDSLGLSSFVTFLGGLPPIQVAEEIRKSELLVLSSRRETFGAVLAEALACGRPVVATRCGGPEDIVTDDIGRLVESENPAALADGIASVLAARGSFSAERLRESAVRRFSAAVVGEQLARLYHEAVAK